MKFNWRANWEILLVLVIIVVGIVITTIAAIKNKDNHLLTLPEETDFRQLLATNGDGGTYPDNTNSSNLHQQDLHNSNTDLDEDGPTIGGGSIVNSQRGLSGTNHVQTIPKPTQSSRYQPNLLLNHHHHHNHQHQHQTKYDDNAEYNKLNTDQQVVTTSSARFTAGDSYEPMSTEPTPNQVRPQADSNHGGATILNNHNHHHIYHNAHSKNHNNNARQFSSSRRYTNRTAHHTNSDDGNGQITNNQQTQHYSDHLGDSVDLIDDIHTTRSSLVGGSNQHNNDANQNKHQLGSASQLEQNQVPLSSMTLHGPYGSMPASMINMLLHNANHKLETGSSPIEPDDLTNSYSRIPLAGGANNITDNMFNDFNLASTLGGGNLLNNNSNSNSSQHQLLSTAMLANLLGTSSNNQDSVTSSNSPQDLFANQQQQTTTATPNHHRGFSSLLPISVILSDLLKLARPHASAASEQQSRPNILQQSRLPGSFLNLIQGLTASNGVNSNLNDINSYINHDASESNQHYHRISMSPTDIHSILARSLGTSGVLPAFPAPKGVAQNWIPPTSGGSPDYNSAFNSNADFVAGNVAGFIRAAPLSSASEQGSHQYNNQPPIDTSYQRQSVGNADPSLSSSGPIDNGPQQQQQQQQLQQGSLGNMDDLNSQQLYQSPPASGLHNDRNWLRANNGPVGFTQNFNGVMRPSSGTNELDNTRRAYRASAPIPISQNNQQNLSPADHSNFVNLQTNQQMNVAKPGFNSLMLGNDVQPQQHNYNHQPALAFNPNSPSEIQVPLGYNPTQQMQHSPTISNNQRMSTSQPHNIQQIRASFESSPQKQQIPVNSMQQQASTVKTQITMNLGGQQQQKQQQQPQQVMRNQQQPLMNIQNQMPTPKNLSRRKRAVVKRDERDRVDEVMSSKYGGSDDEEDDGDLRPISVVSPDGRPMNSGRVRSSSSWKDNYPDSTNDKNLRTMKESDKLVYDRQVAQSQRSANHLDLRGAQFNRDNDDIIRPSNDGYYPQLYRRQRFKSTNALDDSIILEEQEKSKSRGYSLQTKGKTNSRSRQNKNRNVLDAAGSGLMSKLLGTASTNDELEEELDDDDDPSNEKKKEEIEDAEFGIVNDERQNGPQDVMRGNGIGNSASDGGGPNQVELSKQLQPGSNADSGLSSGSTDNESYMRRNQQRSDIEFYGHPGEETRQLKYGILGSGNYEVVNGGIYPEADESTAAVNSVANYVRKPGALLSSLPKILSEQVVDTPTSFMPGGRVGNFLRGASTNPNDVDGTLIQTDLNNKDPLSSPLLELIDANGGQLFGPNILTQLGSSGSSSRTTHTGQESESMNHQDNGDEKQSERGYSLNKQRNKVHSEGIRHENKDNKKMRNKSKLTDEQNDLGNINQDQDMSDDRQQQQQQQATARSKGNLSRNKEFNSGQLQQQQSSISGSRSQGTNQFNSYQILPSKKVTIFSDQDLDSAPSEQKLTSSSLFVIKPNFLHKPSGPSSDIVN